MINELLGKTEHTSRPEQGETWADLALADLESTNPQDRTNWERLLYHAQIAEGSKPSTSWSKTATSLIAPLTDSFVPIIERWFGAVSVPRTEAQQRTYSNYTYNTWEIFCSDRNIRQLKGLAWCCAFRQEYALARSLARLAEVTVKKVPERGPWAIRATSAAIWALGEMSSMESVAALSRLRLRVTHRGMLAQIENALEAQANRQGIGRDDLEDLTVPTFGLTTDGIRKENFGVYTAQMTLTDDGSVTISWYAPDGKPLKSVPASVKRDHAADLKVLKADADAAQKTLSAQRSRIESFISSGRTWTYTQLRQRYLEHPLIGHIARRLIWKFGSDGEVTSGIWISSEVGFVTVDGKAIGTLSDDTIVSLWHPINASVEQIELWRDFLQQHEIRQPFKQAYREIYLLTDAEIRTRVYSNRFASHLLKQHQFNQLALLRGWKNSLRLMVDSDYPPAQLLLPRFGIRAEFWIEGAGEDTNDTGTYLYVATDQVRFYRSNAITNSAHASSGGYYSDTRTAAPEPLALDTIPPLVFSEVMRDVDLFVGVASVGNDPAWADGGPQGRHREYWEDYAFGELSATAQTRATVLARLIPRLKIAPQCRLDGRFLRVEGKLRTYKIHLGSGNILMEPNDQYLCIVQSPTASTNLFLPFEGDSRLSIILSKAFLLADDTKIKDPTILSQIGR